MNLRSTKLKKKNFLGFTACIFLLINLFAGITALYAGDFRYVIRPVITKFVHNLLGILTFVFGMVSLYFAYYLRYTERRASWEVRTTLAWFTIITTVLSCVGALKALKNQGLEVLKMFRENSTPQQRATKTELPK